MSNSNNGSAMRVMVVHSRYLASVAGAMTLASLLLVSVVSRETASSRPVDITREPRIARPANGPALRFYVVATEHEAAAILAGCDALACFGPRPSVSVLVAGTGPADEFLYSGFEALLQAGRDFTVTDKTRQLGPALP